MLQPLPEKDYFTTHDVARLLSVTPRTVQLWCEAGALEFYKTSGGHRRITRQAVEQLQEQSRLSGNTPAARRDAPVAESLRILVVDDEPSLLRLYRLRLGQWSLQPEVVTVSNGFEALIRVGAMLPDLLIADLHMPQWDGFEMLRTIRGIEDMDAMEIVVVSGLDTAEIERRGGLPADIQVLPKPIPFDMLEALATRIAGHKHGAARTA